jgi:hypothetical protein
MSSHFLDLLYASRQLISNSSVWCRLTGTSCNICSPFSDLCCMPRGRSARLTSPRRSIRISSVFSQPRYSHTRNVHPILKSLLQSRRNSAIITLCILGFVFLQFDVGQLAPCFAFSLLHTGQVGEWVGKLIFAPSHLGGITISVWLTWRLQHLKFDLLSSFREII